MSRQAKRYQKDQRPVLNESKRTEREVKAQAVVAKGENQRRYIQSLQVNQLTVATGSAGSGKTFVAASMAANKLIKGEVDKIILTRPYVGMGKDTGFFPGTLTEKLIPFFLPMLNVIKERLGANDVESLIGKRIELQPLLTVRGQTFNDAYVLIDEVQNTTPEEIKALTTRIGENSQMVFCGDVLQSDIRGLNGLQYLVDLINKYDIEGCQVIQFTQADVVRSGLCAEFVKIYDLEGALNAKVK